MGVLRKRKDGIRNVKREFAFIHRIEFWDVPDCRIAACVDAISGQIAPEEFRVSFLRAADEAGITDLTVVQQPPPVRRQVASARP
ncbi:DUF982 domain-containing protein [Rhizobium leguminosarum bv. viciae]|nr:DUF982 domain-containing protein [Rhizobium leguminosarum bv. viciae]